MIRRISVAAAAALVAPLLLAGFGAVSIASADGGYYGPSSYDWHGHYGPWVPGNDQSRNPIVNWNFDGMGNVLVVNNDHIPVPAWRPPAGPVRACFWPDGSFQGWDPLFR